MEMYLVVWNRGEYDSYEFHIDTLWSSRELAEIRMVALNIEFKRPRNDYEAWVEEFIVDMLT